MDLRALTRTDVAAYRALRLRGLRESPTAFARSYDEEQGYTVDAVAERLVGDDRAVFGAFLPGAAPALVGVVGIRRESAPRLAHKAELWGMYVAPEARRQGAGRLLVQRALEHAGAKLGVRQVNLGVNATNAGAIALYERLGFERFGFERGYMIVDGVLQDEVLMVCFVSPR